MSNTLKIGYARVSKADGSQTLDLQLDALKAFGVSENNIYSDTLSGARDDRPGLEACLKSLRQGDTLVVWRLDRLGRSLLHLIKTINDLSDRGINFKTLTGLEVDTTTASGKLIFTIFAALAEFERELIRERTIAGIKAARARGRCGGRPAGLTKAQIRLAQAGMCNRDTSVSALAKELKVSPPTIYAYVTPTGKLTEKGQKALNQK